MKEETKYWRGLEELNKEPEFLEYSNKEFPDYLPVSEKTATGKEGNSRRDFLKLMGFSVAAVSLAACEAPVRNVIPYVNKPVGIEPGRANYYATSYVSGSECTSVLVKTREGRPIKIEPNPESTFSKKGLSHGALASVLDLYDNARLRNFQHNNQKIKRADADKKIIKALKSINKKGGNIRIVSESVVSPSTRQVIDDFIKAYPGTKLIEYDPVSASALRDVHDKAVPDFYFDKADVIVSFSADFLGAWLSSSKFESDYASKRKLNKNDNNMSKHYQFEANMSLTGSNADERVPVKPSEEPHFIAHLHNLIAERTGGKKISGVEAIKNDELKRKEKLEQAATHLLKSKGKSIVASGSNDINVQTLIRSINEMLGNYGKTIDTDAPLLNKRGDDNEMLTFIEELGQGDIDGVIFYNANPVYDHPYGNEIKAALEGSDKAGLKVSFADRPDETAKLCEFICPDYHYLESWGDAEPKKGYFSLMQPTITPIFDQPTKGFENRSAQESLLKWSGDNTSYYDYVRSFWKKNLFDLQTQEVVFDMFWTKVVHDGVFEPGTSFNTRPKSDTTSVNTTEEEEAEQRSPKPYIADVSRAYNKIKKVYQPSSGYELVVYESVQMGTGKSANNPWLNELPDPISKVTWDNYLAVSMADAREHSWKDGDLLNILAKGKEKITLPVVVQPGQKKGTFAVALGYGRTDAGKLSEGVMHKNPMGEQLVGVDVYPFISYVDGYGVNFSTDVKVSEQGTTYMIAQTQTHHTIMGRTIIQDATLKEFKENPEAGRYHPLIETSKGKQKPKEVSVWAEPKSKSKEEYESQKAEGIDQEVVTHEYPNHHWGMVIDMNSCTGCSACITSCISENNIPIVGKDEVSRRREMHWLRIDRYYSTDADTDDHSFSGYKAMEKPSDHPTVIHQPMMCQQCNHAPCETVCPVAATTHSSEGLNQMTYNRCIGTRYCANNCPYKVRRFNWFNYADATNEGREFPQVNTPGNVDLTKMVLNPDVTVRARGVMEKCSFCVQRIQEGKLKAKKDKRKLKDGEVVTACQSACPTEAITFGDMNNKDSEIYKELHENNPDRSYQVLEELNVKPNVNYLTKIRNV